MNIFFFDTETTGLPITKNFNNYNSFKELQFYDNSRLISICWKVLRNDKILSSNYYIIKPNDFKIDNNSVACSINKITNEIANRDGVDINFIFDKIKDDLNNSNLIVAHNINFDKNILLSELYRYKRLDIIEIFLLKNEYCTMLNGLNITKIKFKTNNKYKYPKLNELYKYFYNEDIKNSHNAEADVDACIKCYLKMINV